MLSLKLLNKEKGKNSLWKELLIGKPMYSTPKTWKVWDRWLGRAKYGEDNGSSHEKSSNIPQTLV